MHFLLLSLSIAILFIAAPLVILASRASRAAAAWGSAAAMLTSLLLIAPMMSGVLNNEIVVETWPWLPQWGIDLGVRLDGLSLLFAILILGIGMLIVLYAAYYMPQSDSLGRFYALLLAFAGGMLGMVLSENMIQLVLLWEVTSITSFLLIAYKHEAHDARIAARMALAVTGAGGLALLAGVLVLGQIVGSFNLSRVIDNGDLIRGDALYPLALVLILIGAFTKSAQFPFHFWLPNAMAAPTPVSAYLHSATMVKAGAFLVARIYPAMSGSDLWFYLVFPVGAITLVYGAYLALLQNDFKGLLAYSTISHLGLTMLLFSFDTPMSAVAGVFHIINHAIFKASLFMAAGIIDHECGTRDMRRINGLFWYMPYTAVLGIVAAGSMAGVPLVNGFLSKEMFFAEAVDTAAFGIYSWALPAFATIAGVLSVAYSARFIHDVFFGGDPEDLPRQPHEPAMWMRLPVDVLVLLCLAVGLAPQLVVGPILTAASTAVLPGTVPFFHLSPWHGFNLPLVMSLIAIAGGITYYANSARIIAWHDRYLPSLQSRVGFERLYRWLLQNSQMLMSATDTGSLQRYMALLIGWVIILTGWAFITGTPSSLRGTANLHAADLMTVGGLAAIIAGSLGAVIFHRQRLIAVIHLSVVGLIVALTFIRYSGPDLALTQISVEVVTIVLLLLSLRFLPPEAPNEVGVQRRIRDITLAVAGGTGVAALTYAMLTRSFSTMSGYFTQNAVSGGGGTNVVNVILVDFRGFDTFGEISVLTMAAIGTIVLLHGLRLRPFPPPPAKEADQHPIMLGMLMRPLLPLALVVSVYILLRGHNLPGGGFIAGLITTVALILQFVASGFDFPPLRLRANYLRIMALGLVLAAFTGLGSLVFGKAFLTSAHGHFHIPLVGDIELASAMVFDIGVYLVVVGCVLTILTEFGNLSNREAPLTEPAERS